MTSEELDALAELEKKATAGPWKTRDWRIFNNFTEAAGDIECLVWAAHNKETRTTQRQANIELLHALRNAAHALIEAARRAERYETALRQIAYGEQMRPCDRNIARAALEEPTR